MNLGLGVISSSNVVPTKNDSLSTSNIDLSLANGYYGLTYTFNSLELEDNQPPYCEDVQITGMLGTGNDLTVTATIVNNSIYSLSGIECKIYRANSLQGVLESLVTTISNNTGVFTYTQVTADEGKYIRAEITPKISGGNNKVGDVYSSQYTDILPLTPTVYDVFDIFNLQAWELTNGTFTTWNNKARPAFPAIAGVNAPSVSKGEILFLGSSSQSINVPNPPIIQTWVHYKLIRPTSFSTQVPDTITSGSQFRLQNNRHLFVNNVDTGMLYPNDTTQPYVLKVVHAGASSTITLGTYVDGASLGASTLTWGSPVTFNNNSPSIGTGTGKLGTSGSSFYYSGGYHAYLAASRILTSPEEMAVTDDLKTRIYNWIH